MSEFDDFEVTVPQNYNYCCKVYELMEAEQVPVKADDGSLMRVWEGFFTKLITERLQLSVPYYSAIRGHLIRMGCIKQLRRGGGSSPSQWELLRPPSEALWHSAPVRKGHVTSRQEMSDSQINDLTKRMSRMEENFAILMQTLSTDSTHSTHSTFKKSG